jgi:hypothetical protein
MQPHQQRVVDEKADLDAKIEKLTTFVGGLVFESLSPPEKNWLTQQLNVMGQYSSILGERIAAFPPPSFTIVP